ncbi:MAG: argininosuccinate lyase [Spirochaetales bacterium]|nr:argininosuccinate lyase [Spirochaetales bacterium]
MSKLWQKDYQVDKLIEEFTVGNDYIIDQEIAASDCVASIAHGKMLNKIGILSDKEIQQIEEELKAIIADSMNNKFTIEMGDEDCHTAIENRLISKIGEAGKKIHTGRSRNDQVITALRLYMKAFLLEFTDEALRLCNAIYNFSQQHKDVPMPGRTHMQIAMPSSVGLWASSFGEEISDRVSLILSTYDMINKSPLGSAASYGVPIPLDREMTAQLMGFDCLQNNVLYVNNSRGRFEAEVLHQVEAVVLTLSKIAQDLILFSMPEFKYFSLPDSLCTGSSIMPQKKNPDGLELIRSKSALISGYAASINNITRSLPSGYNRDFQDTKDPFIKGTKLAYMCVKIMTQTFEGVKVHQENLEKGFIPEIYATDIAIEKALAGQSFRDAYKEVGLNIEGVQAQSPAESLGKRTSTGTSGNLNLQYLEDQIEDLLFQAESRKKVFDKAIEDLASQSVTLFR